VISIEDFARIELRVGTVVSAEPIPKAHKLIKLEIDLGERKVVTTAGIAQWYTPEEMLGRRVLVVANLLPRMVMGIESQAMILAASSEGHKTVLVTVAEDIPNGAKVK
jgi:methionyl-tRNA synthetase